MEPMALSDLDPCDGGEDIGEICVSIGFFIFILGGINDNA